MRRHGLVGLMVVAIAVHGLPAQVPASVPLSLEQVVTSALERYPSVRVSEAQVRGAAAAIQLARTAFLPKLDAIAGVNRASRNNVFWMLLPSQIIAPITGPVLGSNNLASTWGSTTGALVTWEPFDFGLRAANVQVAEAGRTRAEAGVAKVRFELATLAADLFLTVAAAEQTVLAAEAGVQRAAELLRITDALVKSELRPGVEASLARAENASAQAQAARSRQAVGEAKAALAGLLGVEPSSIQVSTGKLLLDAPELPGGANPEQNPLAREQETIIAESRARLAAIDRSYFPKIALQGTAYSRGSGATPDGRLLGGANGLAPNTVNWGAGFTVTFPVFEIAGIRARRGAESARAEGEQGRYDQLLADLKVRIDTALASYEGARQIAATTPVAIEAARAAVEQARARYQSGLGTALEIADVQRRLTQSEIDDGLARLNIWRARLMFFAAQGDIGPLLREVGQ